MPVDDRSVQTAAALPRLRARARWLPPAATTAVVAASAATAALGLAGSTWAFPAGAGASAVLGAATALAMLLDPRGGLAVRAMGAAVALWAAGQTWIAVLVLQAPGTEQHPTPGDALQTLAAPLALLGVLALPRPAGYGGHRRALVLDGAVVAAAGAAVLWQTTFLPVVPTGSTAATAAAVVLADLSVLALCLQLAVASLDRGAALAASGVALFVVTDVANTHELVVAGGTWPWLGAAAACAAWPLVGAGFLGAGRRGGGGLLARVPADLRTGALTAAALLVSVASALVTSAFGSRPLDAVSGFLIGLVVFALGARELVHRHQRARLLDDLREQALQDPLTGLGNRNALVASLHRYAAPACAGTAARDVVVVVLDLDGFKLVNAQFGHATGDALLRDLSARLPHALPAGWSAHHLGGDDFAAAGPGDLALGALVADRLRAVVAAPVDLQVVGHLAVTASAGVASAAPGGLDPLSCVAEATAAVRAAKAGGRGRTAVHDAAARQRAARRELVRERLALAVARGGVVAALQPLVEVTTGRVTGFEALARWQDDVLGAVRPDEFIAVAEEGGLVPAVGSAVLRSGLAALVAAGGVAQRLRLSVNASPVELRDPSYADGVLAALAEAGVPVDLLTVEVTEGVFMDTDDPAVAVLEQLGTAGARVAVDDFGTGYSSLSYLERLPVHAVKIDRSLVEGLGRQRPRAVLRAVVELCRALDLHVVAEGVETREQADALVELGVSIGQGWLWSAALAPAQVQDLLAVGRTPVLADGR